MVVKEYRSKVLNLANEAVDVVAELMRDPGVSARVRLMAAQDILNRADSGYDELDGMDAIERADYLFDPKYKERKEREVAQRLEELRAKFSTHQGGNSAKGGNGGMRVN